MFKKEQLSLFDVFSIVAVTFAGLGLLVYLYQSIAPIRTAQFTSPVQTDKTEYHLGEVVVGTFYGEVFTTVRPVIGRRLICAHQTQALTDFESRVGVPGKIDGRRSNIVQLADASLKVGGNLMPDTSCVIQFTAIYQYPRILGEPRLEQVNYYTTPFDIVAADVSSASEASGVATSQSSVPVGLSTVSMATNPPAASPAPTTVFTSQPTPSAGQQSIIQRILNAVTGVL